MAQKKTPGVYVVEKSTLPPSVAEVATAIPVFVGYTEKHMDASGNDFTNQPTRIKNMSEYIATFGGKYPEAFNVLGNANDGYFLDPNTQSQTDFVLPQAVEHYFANGGGLCYIVTLGSFFKQGNGTREYVKTAGGTFISKDAFSELGSAQIYSLMAANQKKAANFSVALKAISKVDEITLISLVDAVTLDADKYYSLQNTAIDQCRKLQDRFTVIDTQQTGGSIAEDSAALRDRVAGELKYGAAYYPNVQTVYARHYDLDSAKVNGMSLRTLGGLEVNVGSVEIAEGATDQTQPTLNELDDAQKDTALYNNMLQLLSRNPLILPPSPSVCGVMAKVDKERGVWKAPANVALLAVNKPTITIRADQQENLNVDADSGKSINAIRHFTGKGNLIWGARTLLGNDNEWRYVSVRRFFNMVEESIQKSTGFAVFEPNTPFTWLKIKTMIESYLTNLWRQGALFGDSADQAFFVNVGLGQTMTEDDINNGIMNIEIGMAAVRPAEFVILTFSHKSLEG